MNAVETINQPVDYNNNFSNLVPNTVPEIYNMALEINHRIQSCMQDVEQLMNPEYSQTIKMMQSFQHNEEIKIGLLLSHELNYCYQLFFEQKSPGLLVNRGNLNLPVIDCFVQNSLNALKEKINNLILISQQQQRLNTDFLVLLFLGLRDYCANFYQQMAANYHQDELIRCFYQLSELTDQISDEIGAAFSCT